ncbi:MAG: hypothetical protein BWY83_02332 [bacterium ADurb.Bin478]|nr:MAG: hypothetical protein BWY83_02332 [bacterium ADurb.Bin478]
MADMRGTAFDPKDVDKVRVPPGYVDHRDRPLEPPDAVDIRRGCTYRPQHRAIGPERRGPLDRLAAALLVAPVDHHRVVRCGLAIPERFIRSPAAELHRRITKGRQQIQSACKQADVHGVRMTVVAADVIIDPQGPLIPAAAAVKHGQAPLLFIKGVNLRRNAVLFNDRRHLLLKAFAGRQQVVGQSLQRTLIFPVKDLNICRVAGDVEKLLKQRIAAGKRIGERFRGNGIAGEQGAHIVFRLLRKDAAIADVGIVLFGEPGVDVKAEGFVQVRVPRHQICYK